MSLTGSRTLVFGPQLSVLFGKELNSCWRKYTEEGSCHSGQPHLTSTLLVSICGRKAIRQLPGLATCHAFLATMNPPSGAIGTNELFYKLL